MALENRDIFILGATKFDGPYESTSYTVARYLARYNRVYYIDYPFTWKDYIRQKGTSEYIIRKPYLKPGSNGVLDTDIPGLKIIFIPLLYSINFLPEGWLYRLFLRLNERIITKRLKQVIRLLNIKDYIYINSFNFHYPDIAKNLSPVLTVYHCVDPLIIEYDKRHGVVSEHKLITQSDIVICTSKQLADEKRALNPHTYFVPNAADISHSGKALDEGLEIHESIRNLPKPVIGYFGTIERRMDFELLKQVIESNPDKSFAFVGPLSPEFVPEWFSNTPNVYLPGRQDYKDMPAIIKGFDVAIIPFKKDDVSKTIFPLKLFEYLGAGKPVVITNFNPDLKEFTQGAVTFCNNAEEFNQAINDSLKNNTFSMRQQRIQVAQQNTWHKRVEEIGNIISAAIKSDRPF